MVFSSIPQVITEDRSSGAQFIEGSLKFDGSKSTRLERTFPSAGNRTSWTWSCWVKRDILTLSNRQVIFGGYGASNDTDWLELGFDDSNDKVYFTTSSISTAGTPERRDPDGWYHFFSTYDGSNLKIYVNNNLDLNHSFSGNRGINSNVRHFIGQTPNNSVDRHLDGRLTQCYFIDGQVLNPSDFAYTDPLTNTWRPKKYDGTFGTNGFYLPMDGNTPIGKDQSGNGNDFTPVNFGGSMELPKATGAIPILNTNESGTVGKPGVRTDKKTYTVTASGGNYYIDGALKPTLNAYRGGSYTFDYTGASGHPFYLSSLQDGKWNSKAYSVQFDGSNDYLNISDNNDWDIGTNPFTIECFVNINSSSTSYSGIFGMHTGSTQFQWRINNVGRLQFLQDFGGTRGNENDNDTSGTDLRDNTWHHVALTRQSDNSWQLYVDGIVEYSGTGMTGNVTGINEVSLGRRVDNNSNYLTGYISNLRFVSGTALYSSNFTPPTTTLTNVSGTILLCCQDSNATTGAVLPTNASIATSGAAATQSKQPFLYDNNHGNFGVNTATSNTTKITIPHTAADTLYYYCQNHSGMGSSINVTTDIHKADPYAWKNIISMPLNNAADESGSINVNQTSQTVTNSNTSFTGLSNFYGSTASFTRSSSNFLSVPDSAGIELGRDDFTIEFWLYLNNTTNHYEGIISKPGNADAQAAPMIYKETSGNIHINFSEAGSNNWNIGQFIGNCAQLAFKWHHVAVTRSRNTFRWFLDGVLVKTQTSPNTLWNNGNPLYIGKYTMFPGTNTYGFDGYLQDFRFYKGVAKYLGNIGDQVYTPASTAPDILPVTPSGITGKTNLTKITGGAVAFDGDRDYLGVGPSSDFDMDGDFTAEAWVYPTSHANDYAGIFGFSYDSEGTGWNVLVRSGSGRLHMNVDMTHTDVTGSLALNKWTHVALVRSGTGSGNCKLYIDGIADPTTITDSDTTGTPSGKQCYIGSYPGYESAREFTGFISNARVIKGTALYTSNFTPPTEPLTAVTNTKLLCCQSPTSAGTAAVSPTAVSTPDGGYAFNRVKLYSVFGGGSRNANYTVEYSDDNSSWTTAFTGNMATSGCGLVTASGGGGNYGKHPYWRYTNNEGTGSHHPRMARLVLSDGTTDVNIQTFTGDNCSDQGTIPGNGTQYTYTDSTYAINNTAATNFNPFTDDINAIRGQETGYCTWNALSNKGGTLSDGNLKYSHSGTANISATIMIPNSGKWFWEYNIIRQVGGGVFGIGDGSGQHMRATDLGWWSKIYGYSPNGNKYEGGGNAAYGPTFGAGDILGVAYNSDTRELRFYLNGVDKGVAFTTSSAFDYYPALHINNSDVVANFGQKPFKFLPPDGFQPLNLSNVQPEKVIARPDQYVGTSLYTGNGGTLSVTNLNFKPDLVWIKCKSHADDHTLTDSVRGADRALYSNNPNQENVSSIRLQSFNNDGFTTGSSGDTNTSGRTFCAWTWKAGGNKNTFNIDDVGYANASDVNMNVGGLNSSTYDQSQNWTNNVSSTSNITSGHEARLFNGILSGSNADIQSNQGTVGVINFSSAITGSKIEIYTIGNVGQIGINGSNLSVTANQWVDTGVTSLTSVETRHPGAGSIQNPTGLKVDGKILVDSGLSVTNVPTIAPTGCSVGTKQGFSIIKYSVSSTSTVAHGLTQAPEFGIFKCTSEDNSNWGVYYTVNGNNSNWMSLNSTNAQGSGVDFVKFYDKHVQIASNSFAGQGSAGVGYMWHSVPGLQKFGTYIGNGNADGPFVELGFRPALVLRKCITVGANGYDWVIIDSARNTYNVANSKLYPNENGQENVNSDNSDSGNNSSIDILSNGFKVRAQNGRMNGAGENYIYAAWAEAPSINLYGGQSNAR